MTNTNPLRNEIIGHIEASGELACWIVPYLYHAAYQTVKDMERDGTLVIEVGKRGEPVYVFAPAPAPAPTAKRPIPVLSADEAELLDDMLAYDPHYERTEKREPKKHQMLVEMEKQGLVFWYKNPGEDKAWTLSSWGRSVAAHYNVADDGSDDPFEAGLLAIEAEGKTVLDVMREVDATPAPARAADDAAKAAPKLTKAQRALLERMMQGPADRYSRGYNLQTARWLVKHGYAHPRGFNASNYSSIEITDAGRAALKASER